MLEFLDQISRTIPEDEHVALLADQAGRHVAIALKVPANISLLALAAYSPELNPVERIWLYLEERFLSHRLLDDYEPIVEAACKAWQRLKAEPGRLASLTGYPWIEAINS
jgi:transposase